MKRITDRMKILELKQDIKDLEHELRATNALLAISTAGQKLARAECSALYRAMNVIELALKEKGIEVPK